MNDTPTTYRRATLTDEQRRALGPDMTVTFVTHTHISHMLTILAKEQGISKRDLINEIFINYINQHTKQ